MHKSKYHQFVVSSQSENTCISFAQVKWKHITRSQETLLCSLPNITLLLLPRDKHYPGFKHYHSGFSVLRNFINVIICYVFLVLASFTQYFLLLLLEDIYSFFFCGNVVYYVNVSILLLTEIWVFSVFSYYE